MWWVCGCGSGARIAKTQCGRMSLNGINKIEATRRREKIEPFMQNKLNHKLHARQMQKTCFAFSYCSQFPRMILANNISITGLFNFWFRGRRSEKRPKAFNLTKKKKEAKRSDEATQQMADISVIIHHGIPKHMGLNTLNKEVCMQMFANSTTTSTAAPAPLASHK